MPVVRIIEFQGSCKGNEHILSAGDDFLVGVLIGNSRGMVLSCHAPDACMAF